MSCIGLLICINYNINVGGPYGGTPGKNENEASGNPVGQNTYEDGYNIPQVCHSPHAILFLLQYHGTILVLCIIVFLHLI